MILKKRKIKDASPKITIKEFNKQFADANEKNNMILTKNLKFSLDTKKTKRNNNACVIGLAGAQKLKHFFKPNILQANCNYVITDTCGELLKSTGGFLKEQGYTIKVLNLSEIDKSDCYNPFEYIKNDEDVYCLVENLIKNTAIPGTKIFADPFWEKAEGCLLQVIVFYLVKHRPREEYNFASVMKLLKAAEVENENTKSELDCLFDEIAETEPNSIALKRYQIFKMATGKTLKSTLISCSIRLAAFNLDYIKNLTNTDTIDLYSIKNNKTAIFIVLPVERTYHFLANMLCAQLFNILHNHEEFFPNKEAVPHIRFLFDNIDSPGYITEFGKYMVLNGKNNASCSFYVHNISEIQALYENDWEVIIGNCDSQLYLGGSCPGEKMLDFLIKRTGKSADEIKNLPSDKCILITHGEGVIVDDKYNYTEHPNYIKKQIKQKKSG